MRWNAIKNVCLLGIFAFGGILTYANEVIVDDIYERIEFTDKGDEYVVSLSPDQYDDEAEMTLWIFRQYPENREYYTYVIRDRKINVDEQGYIHIAKNQSVIGVWNEQKEDYTVVPWLWEFAEDTICWKTGNFCLMYDEYRSFVYESNYMHLVLAETEDGSIDYICTEDEEEKRLPVQSGSCFCLAEGDRRPYYTVNGCLADFSSWTTGYAAAEILTCDDPKGGIRFSRMTISDFVSDTFVGQVVIKKEDGSYLTTDLMLLQNGLETQKRIETKPDRKNRKDFPLDENDPAVKKIGDGIYSEDGKILYEVSGDVSETFTVPDGVEEIGAYAFEAVTLKKIVIPDSVSVIGMRAFSGNQAELSSIKLDETEPSAAKSIVIGKNVEYIGPGAFRGVYAEEFIVDPDNTHYKSENGLLLTKDGKYLLACPTGLGGVLNIPEGVEQVYSSAFENNGLYGYLGEQYLGITEMHLPSTMKYFDLIDIPANLKEVYLNEGLLSYDSMTLNYHSILVRMPENSEDNGVLLSDDGKCLAFLQNEKLHGYLRLPETVTRFGKNIFSSAQLKTLVFPAGLKLSETSVYELAGILAEIRGLEGIIVEDGNESFCSIDGVLYTKDGTVLICYPSAKEGTDFSIPEGVQTVAAEAFNRNEYIRTLTIPSTLSQLKLRSDYRIFLDSFRNLNQLIISDENPYFVVENKTMVRKSNQSVIYSIADVIEGDPWSTE